MPCRDPVPRGKRATGCSPAGWRRLPWVVHAYSVARYPSQHHDSGMSKRLLDQLLDGIGQLGDGAPAVQL